MNNLDSIIDFLKIYPELMIPFVYDLVGFASVTLLMSPFLLLGFLYLKFVNYSRQFIQKNIILKLFPSLKEVVGTGNKVISKLTSTFWFCSISLCIVTDILLLFRYR